MILRISGDKIHNGQEWLPPNTFLEINEKGVITKIDQIGSNDNVKHYPGVICPGFVNAHCHSELSHLKDAVKPVSGLRIFLESVILKRNACEEAHKKLRIEKAIAHMYEQGINGLGDIANTADALPYLANSPIQTIIFVEALGFEATRAKEAFQRAQKLATTWQSVPSKQIKGIQVCAHAPYSVSAPLFKLIAQASSPDLPQSLHNQEWAAEDELFQNKTGEALLLLERLGINTASFVSTGLSSLRSVKPNFLANQKILLVHNTFTSEEEIKESSAANLWWCLCPKANWFIEKRLPNVMSFIKHSDNLCIGTDSLASNDSLNILSELQFLKVYYPQLEWSQLLRWATANGAHALGLEELGVLKENTAPGVINITDLNDAASIKRIA